MRSKGGLGDSDDLVVRVDGDHDILSHRYPSPLPGLYRVASITKELFSVWATTIAIALR
jgi:hypothetical protein